MPADDPQPSRLRDARPGGHATVDHFHGKDLGVPVRLAIRKAKSYVFPAISGTDARLAESPFPPELRRL
jgi:hypothetical protein